MFVDLLSSRAIQFGLAFFLVVVCSSLLYSWHIQRTTEGERTRSNETLQPIEPPNATPNEEIRPVDFGGAGVPLEMKTPQTLVGTVVDLTVVPVDLSGVFLSEDVASARAEPVEDVPVSPFGFGPYPEVPIGYPENLSPVWTWSEEKRRQHEGHLVSFELMHRVLIKLYNQGDGGFIGVTLSDQDGNVYPLYSDRVYVDRWVELFKDENGEPVLYPAGTLSGSDLGGALDPETFMRSDGKLPAGIQFIDRETAGINPYEFLELK